MPSGAALAAALPAAVGELGPVGESPGLELLAGTAIPSDHAAARAADGASPRPEATAKLIRDNAELRAEVREVVSVLRQLERDMEAIKPEDKGWLGADPGDVQAEVKAVEGSLGQLEELLSSMLPS